MITVESAETEPSPVQTVDAWFGTVFHRQPLLSKNTRHVGLAVHEAGGTRIAIVDPESLWGMEGQDHDAPGVLWPPRDMNDVPRRFHGDELPEPLGDVPGGPQARTAGYPVSLKLPASAVELLETASIELLQLGNRSEPSQNVPVWTHTPDRPLLGRMEGREMVFAIPREPLAANTTFQVVVRYELTTGFSDEVEWRFTTGRRMVGLGRR